jgi:hypothetical protein
LRKEKQDKLDKILEKSQKRFRKFNRKGIKILNKNNNGKV